MIRLCYQGSWISDKCHSSLVTHSFFCRKGWLLFFPKSYMSLPHPSSTTTLKNTSKKPPFLKATPFSATPTITHPPPAIPIKSPAFHPFGPSPKVPRSPDTWNASAWMAEESASKRFITILGQKGGVGFNQAVVFNRWCSESQRDHKVETPSFLGQKMPEVSGTNVKNNSHQLQYTYIFRGGLCPFLNGTLICISKH